MPNLSIRFVTALRSKICPPLFTAIDGKHWQKSLEKTFRTKLQWPTIIACVNHIRALANHSSSTINKLGGFTYQLGIWQQPSEKAIYRKPSEELKRDIEAYFIQMDRVSQRFILDLIICQQEYINSSLTTSLVVATDVSLVALLSLASKKAAIALGSLFLACSALPMAVNKLNSNKQSPEIDVLEEILDYLEKLHMDNQPASAHTGSEHQPSTTAGYLTDVSDEADGSEMSDVSVVPASPSASPR